MLEVVLLLSYCCGLITRDLMLLYFPLWLQLLQFGRARVSRPNPRPAKVNASPDKARLEACAIATQAGPIHYRTGSG